MSGDVGEEDLRSERGFGEGETRDGVGVSGWWWGGEVRVEEHEGGEEARGVGERGENDGGS